MEKNKENIGETSPQLAYEDLDSPLAKKLLKKGGVYEMYRDTVSFWMKETDAVFDELLPKGDASEYSVTMLMRVAHFLLYVYSGHPGFDLEEKPELIGKLNEAKRVLRKVFSEKGGKKSSKADRFRATDKEIQTLRRFFNESKAITRKALDLDPEFAVKAFFFSELITTIRFESSRLGGGPVVIAYGAEEITAALSLPFGKFVDVVCKTLLRQATTGDAFPEDDGKEGGPNPRTYN